MIITTRFSIHKPLALLSAAAFLAAANTALTQSVPFSKVITGAVATDTGQFTQPSWADFENRGLLDLMVGNYDGLNVYYRNNGDRTFTKIAQRDPILGVADHTGLMAVDYDNDGYPDVVSLAGGGSVAMGQIVLFHNNRNGTFTSTSGGQIADFTDFFNTGGWADYDGDGFVDLVVGKADPSGIGRNSLIFHNNGDGTFNSVTNGIVLDKVNAASVAWADYDGDGAIDLIITSSTAASASRCFLYHNDGNGSFTRILTNAVATDTWSDGPWVATWGDYDNDGLSDLFVTGVGANSRLYHNDGNGAFSHVLSGAMLQPPAGGASWSCAWGDYDNDGYLDLLVTSYNAPNRLFHNNGDGSFTKVTGGVFAADGNLGIYSQTCSWADYDNDGSLDLFITRFPDSGTTSNLLYHNDGNTNGWLEVKLIGTASNRPAIGAKVRAQATIGGKSFWQLHEVTAGGGRWVQPLVAHFGLGNATNVNTLRVEWPSGIVQEFQNVAPRQILTVTEPPRLLAAITNSTPLFSLKAWPGMQFNVQTSIDLATWSPLGLLEVTNPDGTAQIINTNGPDLNHRFFRALAP